MSDRRARELVTSDNWLRDLRALEAAQQQWQSGAISEQEYIERAVAAMMHELDALMTPEERQNNARVLRYICHTSPVMRTRLGLDPFEDGGCRLSSSEKLQEPRGGLSCCRRFRTPSTAE